MIEVGTILRFNKKQIIFNRTFYNKLGIVEILYADSVSLRICEDDHYTINPKTFPMKFLERFDII